MCVFLFRTFPINAIFVEVLILIKKPATTFSSFAVRVHSVAMMYSILRAFCLFEGTGKTVTGVHIAYWFAKRNKQFQLQRDQDPSDIALPDSASKPKAPPQVIYCGPSNKSVDVVASKYAKV